MSERFPPALADTPSAMKRTAIEALLVSDAIERAVMKIDLA
jgi:hypothetical protein